MSELTQSMDDKISEALDNHDCLIPLLSGGKDSMTVTHHAFTRFKKYCKPPVFINTSVSVLATRHFVLNEQKKHGWGLQMLYPRITFKEYVIDYANGFPSKGNHRFVMGYLKYWPMKKWFQTLLGEGLKPIYVSGVRKRESKRRTKNYATPFVKDGRMEFVASAFDLHNVDVWDYVKNNNLERAPAYEILGYGGDCLCGSFAEKEELKLLEQFYKKEFANIKWIESLIPQRLIEIEKEILIREANESKLLSWKKKSDRKKLQLLYKQRRNLKVYNHWGDAGSTDDIETQQELEKFAVAEDMVCGTDGCQMLLQERLAN